MCLHDLTAHAVAWVLFQGSGCAAAICAASPTKGLLLKGLLYCRPQLVKGFMQLYSVEQKRSQALEAHAAAFSTLKSPGSDQQSIVISFAQKTFANGTLNSKLHVIELGATPGTPPCTTRH